MQPHQPLPGYRFSIPIADLITKQVANAHLVGGLVFLCAVCLFDRRMKLVELLSNIRDDTYLGEGNTYRREVGKALDDGFRQGIL